MLPAASPPLAVGRCAAFALPASAGARARRRAAEGGGAYDFTALDRVMPHPVYGQMYWVCVLNPEAETFEREVQPLLAEAYALAVGKYDKKAARG